MREWRMDLMAVGDLAFEVHAKSIRLLRFCSSRSLSDGDTGALKLCNPWQRWGKTTGGLILGVEGTLGSML